jgi:hypothetical protein
MRKKMSIKKMLLLAGMALAAIAFAAPAVAQAEITLTDNGEPLPDGAKVTATSENLETHTANGSIQCEKVTLHFEVTTNGHEHVVLAPLGEMSALNCSVNGVVPITMTDGTVTSDLTFDTWGTGEADATVTFDIFPQGDPGPFLPCHFQTEDPPDGDGPLHLQATDGTDIIHLDGVLIETGTPGCAAESDITGTFTMETTSGTPIIFDHVETE